MTGELQLGVEKLLITKIFMMIACDFIDFVIANLSNVLVSCYLGCKNVMLPTDNMPLLQASDWIKPKSLFLYFSENFPVLQK